MGIIEAYKACIAKYATFQGRARRSEFWYFVLGDLLITSLLGILLAAAASSFLRFLIFISIFLEGAYRVLSLLPRLSVMVRRLHDTGHSGWSILLAAVPILIIILSFRLLFTGHVEWFTLLFLISLSGPVILLIWLCKDSYTGTNQYGESPKANSFYNPGAVQGSPAHQQPIFPPPNRLPNTIASIDNPSPGNGLFASVSSLGARELQAICVKGNARGKRVSGKTIYIGRDPQLCQLVFPQDTPGVSRTHCMLHLVTNAGRESYVELKDLNSTYGTFLPNGNRVNPNSIVRLKNGDSFFVGSQENMVSVTC